jgi:hypothetical protein
MFALYKIPPFIFFFLFNCAGYITSKVLAVLDILDRHCFDRVDSTNNLDCLYNNIFAVINNKEGNEVGCFLSLLFTFSLIKS